MFVEYAKIHDDALSDILDKEYPYKNRYVGGKHFDGDIILSRYPIKKIEHQVLPWSRSFTHVRLKKENVPLDIALIHTSAPVSSELFDQRNQQMDKLIEILWEYYTGNNNISDRNIIVLGDFNISPRSPYYTTFNTHAKNIWLYNISTNIHNTLYNEIFPYTRCHSDLPIICSHIDHIRSNNTGLSLQHIQIPWSDHDGFIGSISQ
jgi:endonuclease/exonuclease/phosphatase family metal-dependent hydrolase